MSKRGKTPPEPGSVGDVTPQDPDIAAIVARLGLRGMRYRSFGNRPVAVRSLVPASGPPKPAVAPSPAPPDMPSPLPAAVPAAAPVAAPQPLAPAALAHFPLLAAALYAAPSTPAAAPTESTLVFLGLRTAHTTQGR